MISNKKNGGHRTWISGRVYYFHRFESSGKRDRFDMGPADCEGMIFSHFLVCTFAAIYTVNAAIFGTAELDAFVQILLGVRRVTH